LAEEDGPMHSPQPHLPDAKYVTITFVSQKNGKKMDLRTQCWTSNLVLCPVLRYGWVIRRILCQNPAAPKDTKIVTISFGTKTGTINDYVRELLQTTCTNFGRKTTFAYNSIKFGNKFICAGTAMSLFLSNVSTARIMLSGHWFSCAFLAYIWPQVLEWTSNMSRSSMIKIKSFLDPYSHDVADNDNPQQQKQFKAFFSNTILMPKLHLHH
jgi:hypothetical protein